MHIIMFNWRLYDQFLRYSNLQCCLIHYSVNKVMRLMTKVMMTMNLHWPVAHQRWQDHQGVLHLRHNLWCGVSSKQKFSPILEVRKDEISHIPFRYYSFQFCFYFLLLHCWYADILKEGNQLIVWCFIFLCLSQGRHNIEKFKPLYPIWKVWR